MPLVKKGLWSKLTNYKDQSQPRTELIRQVDHYEQRLIELCCLPLNETLARLETSFQGLTAEQAEERLNEFGPNELTNKEKLSFWADIGRRLKSSLIIQLLAIAIISAMIGEAKSTAVVSLMVLLIVALSYLLDRRSFQAVEALGKRVQSRTWY